MNILILITILIFIPGMSVAQQRNEYSPTKFEKNIFHIEAGKSGLNLLKLIKLLKIIEKEDWGQAERLLIASEGAHGRKSYSFAVNGNDDVKSVTLSGPSNSIKNGEPLIDRIEVTRTDRSVIIGLEQGRYIIEWISAPAVSRK